MQTPVSSIEFQSNQRVAPGRKTLLACAVLAMLAGNQAMADVTVGNETPVGGNTVVIDDTAAENLAILNGSNAELILTRDYTGTANTTTINTTNSSISGDLGVTGDVNAANATVGTINASTVNSTAINNSGAITSNSVSATTISGGTITGSLNAAGNVISNVGNGQVDTDAVNIRQLNAAQSNSNGRIDALASQTDARFNSMDRRIDDIAERAYGGIASVAALAAIPAPASGKRFSVGAGLGSYSNENAVAVGFRAALTESTSVTAGISRNSAARSVANLGVGYSW